MQERYRLAWGRLTAIPAQEADLPSVTIIIAARNEVHRIRPTLNALHRLVYPGPLEILILDDHSTDGTADLIRDHLPPRARCLALSGTGKRAALVEGLQVASGEIILLTDADCVPGIDWASSMIQPFSHPGIDWVSGPVTSVAGTDMVSRYDALEWQGLMVITGAGFALGRPVLAQGANMAFRKSRLAELGGIQGFPSRASGDDVFLLSLFQQDDAHRCHFQQDIRALVQTAAPDSWRALVRQRLRWTSKSGHLDVWHGLAPMALTWLACLVLLATPVLFYALPAHSAPLSLLPILVKFMADYRLLRAGWQFSCARFTWMDVLLASLIQPVLVVISGWIGPLRPGYLWKGRRVQ
ncbi:MAG: glycosyltransferase [Lewinellaceae bacterium]|nr:glycosyltransferase [Saprospiraceae bacterium]MCB9314057.1 glycosyltransferase [Lewinellaceae bacterium]